jgi:hypothetical protein
LVRFSATPRCACRKVARMFEPYRRKYQDFCTTREPLIFRGIFGAEIRCGIPLSFRRRPPLPPAIALARCAPWRTIAMTPPAFIRPMTGRSADVIRITRSYGTWGETSSLTVIVRHAFRDPRGVVQVLLHDLFALSRSGLRFLCARVFRKAQAATPHDGCPKERREYYTDDPKTSYS